MCVGAILTYGAPARRDLIYPTDVKPMSTMKRV